MRALRQHEPSDHPLCGRSVRSVVSDHRGQAPVCPVGPEDVRRAVDAATRSRSAQGLPATVIDTLVLDQVAELLHLAGPGRVRRHEERRARSA